MNSSVGLGVMGEGKTREPQSSQETKGRVASGGRHLQGVTEGERTSWMEGQKWSGGECGRPRDPVSPAFELTV